MFVYVSDIKGNDFIRLGVFCIKDYNKCLNIKLVKF